MQPNAEFYEENETWALKTEAQQLLFQSFTAKKSESDHTNTAL